MKSKDEYARDGEVFFSVTNAKMTKTIYTSNREKVKQKGTKYSKAK